MKEREREREHWSTAHVHTVLVVHVARQRFTWDWHGPRCLLLKDLMKHQLKNVGKVRKMRTCPSYLKGLATKTVGMGVREKINMS